MSSAEEELAAEVCASCGKVEVDDIKLKKCTACKLVKYCGVACQKEHWSQHKRACKKRAAELRDDRLFTQPDISCYGECPICLLPLSLDRSKSVMMSCCCTLICRGCDCANTLREIEQGLDQRCAFCREPVVGSQEECTENEVKRARSDDPVALYQVGCKCYDRREYDRAFEYFTKSARLGYAESHHSLYCMYRDGQVVEKDEKKKVYHLEESAIAGHPMARYDLGILEEDRGRDDRAIKHFIIAAKLGYDDALEVVKEHFGSCPYLSKEDFEAALREHQAAVDATKSAKREEAHAFYSSIT